MKDIIHGAVRQALIKDDWTITHDPFTMKYGDARLFADLAAERTLAAERDGQKIIGSTGFHGVDSDRHSC